MEKIISGNDKSKYAQALERNVFAQKLQYDVHLLGMNR